jgi:hypothetical protein
VDFALKPYNSYSEVWTMLSRLYVIDWYSAPSKTYGMSLGTFSDMLAMQSYRTIINCEIYQYEGI